MPLTAHDDAANKSVESVNEQDVAGVGTGYGRGPGAGDPHRSLPPIPRRQDSQASEYYSPHRQPSDDSRINGSYHPSREQTPSQPGYPRRQNSDYNAPYVPNMYSVQRPFPAPAPAPLAFPTPQSAGVPSRSPTYPPVAAGPMTAPLAAPTAWVPPLREDTATPYRHQSTPFQPRQQASGGAPYGHQQSASVPAINYGHQQEEQPSYGGREYTRSPQPWLPPVETGPPVTLDQGQTSFHAGAAAASRHHHSQSETTYYAPRPHASRQNTMPSHQQGQPAVLSPPMDVYDSYYQESPSAIPYARDSSHGPSPSYHTSDANAYPSYGGNVHR